MDTFALALFFLCSKAKPSKILKFILNAQLWKTKQSKLKFISNYIMLWNVESVESKKK